MEYHRKNLWEYSSLIYVQREGVVSIIMHTSFCIAIHTLIYPMLSRGIGIPIHASFFTISNGLIIHTSYLYLTSFIPSIKIRRKFLSFSYISYVEEISIPGSSYRVTQCYWIDFTRNRTSALCRVNLTQRVRAP